jgi:hypothetical protein
MKKLFIQFSVFFIVAGITTINAQLKTNTNFFEESSNQSFFLDAASTTNGEKLLSMVGKGLIFPRVDLVNLALTEPLDAFDGGYSGGNPNDFDSMIVYNTGTGTVTNFGGGSVTPGFYYYDNSAIAFDAGGGNWDQGTWKPLGSAGSPKIHITENTPTETNLVTANTATEKVISITGTADGITTHIDLGTTVLPKDTVINFRKAIICDSTGKQVLVATGSYDSATNKFVTGNGMMNYCLPAANDYKVELYFTSN